MIMHAQNDCLVKGNLAEGIENAGRCIVLFEEKPNKENSIVSLESANNLKVFN